MKASRTWLWIPWAAFVVLAILWVAYWNIVANSVRGRVQSWSAAQAATGAHFTYANLTAHGFPVLLRFEFANPAYAPAGASWHADTPRIDLNVNLIDPQHVIFQFPAPVVITRVAGTTTTFNARTTLVSVRTHGAALAEVRFESDAPTLQDSARPGVLSAQKLVVGLRADPRAATDEQLAIEAIALHLAQPVKGFETFGQDIATANAAIVIEHAAALLAPTRPLETWRSGGGRARLEGLQLNWGPLDAEGHGDVALDDQRRLRGQLEVTLPHPAPALSALSNSPSLSHDAKDALSVFALGFTLSGHHVKAHLDAADGVLRVEHIPVRTLAPLY